MLCFLSGLNAANATNPCPWCISEKKDFKHPNHQINRIYCEVKREVGQDKEPLFPSDLIKTENIVFVLHMFLRVSEKLMVLLRNDLQHMETTFSENIDLNVHFKGLVEFLLSIKIRKPYYLKDKSLTIRDLSGVEFIKVFEKIVISTFNLEMGDKKNVHGIIFMI